MESGKRHIITTILTGLAALLCAASCDLLGGSIDVEDMGFDVSTDIVWNSEYMAYTLRLSLDRGSDGRYVMDYSIDGDPTVKLLSAPGTEFETGKQVELSTRSGAVLILPVLSPSRQHRLELHFTGEAGVERHYALDLPNTNQNEIGIRIDASETNDYTRVILTNLMGPSVTTYTVTFSLDGSPLEGIKYMGSSFGGTMDIDFARSESYTFEMPYLPAGEHILRIEVRSQLGSETGSVSFLEPQRRQTSLAFRYNDYTGNLTLESDYNPGGTVFSVTADYTVRGSITYRPKRFLGVSDRQTETFTATGEASTPNITPGLSAASVDEGLLRRLMDQVYSNTRTDAANAIGNGNARTLHADISSIEIRLTVHSLGDRAGKTAVSVSPADGKALPVKYTYEEETWSHSARSSQSILPTLYLNGGQPSDIGVL